MRLTALEAIEQEHENILVLADRIADTLERRVTKSDLEILVYEVLAQYERQVRVHLAHEKQVFLDVLREHLGDAHPETIDGAIEGAYALEQAMGRLRIGVEAGEPLRILLEDAEIALREYIEYEETHVLPWGTQMLGADLLQEVERRHRSFEDDEQAVAIEEPVRRADHPPLI